MQDLRAAIRNQPPAQPEYDWAPFHMPGAVQAYGVLLVAEPQSRRVLFVSENAHELLGIAPAEILDKSYLRLTDNERERKLLSDKIAADTILFPNPVRLTIKGREFDAVFHAHGGHHQIELEPAQSGGETYDEMSLRSTVELFDPTSVEDLCQRAVRTVREVSGYDRVMLYRFDARYNGQVIAESTRDGIGSFLGLFFPSSDIPARMRDLYLRNFTRYIPDIGCKNYRLSGVMPGAGGPDSAHPVDMSYTNLRSVYACHTDYLKNMGVKASMSFSINVDGKLWGLFACHHYAPRHISYDQRVVCEQAAMMFIYRLEVMTSAAARLARRREALTALGRSIVVGAALQRRLGGLEGEWRGTADEAAARTLLRRAAAAVQAESSFLLPGDPAAAPAADAAVSEQQQMLLDLVEADSAAIVRNGRVCRIGDAPPEIAVYAIAAMLGRELPNVREGDLHVFATDCLTSVVPAAETVKDRAAGILAVALSLHAPAYLIWFRREQIVHATWAGNPQADALAAGSTGQNPRASFEAWKQDIRNLSRPWLLEDVQIADALAGILRSLDAGGEVGHADVWVPPPMPAYAAPVPAYAAPPPAPVAPPRRVIRIGQR